ncbi:MAG: hypothetical protein ACOYEK_07345 [bacterium]|jgi:hypothetical protein
MDKDRGAPSPEGEKTRAKEEQLLLTERWAEASNWNPDDFETHPARRKYIAGKKPIPPRQG